MRPSLDNFHDNSTLFVLFNHIASKSLNVGTVKGCPLVSITELPSKFCAALGLVPNSGLNMLGLFAVSILK